MADLRVEPEADGTQYWPKSHLDPRAPDLALELKEGDAAMESSASGGDVADVAAGGAGGVTHERML